MATKISAVLTVTDTNQKTASKSLTDISPTADKGRIVNLARALVALTTGTLDGVELVTKEDITNEKPAPNLTVTPNTANGLSGDAMSFQLAFDGDATPTASPTLKGQYGGFTYNAANKTFNVAATQGLPYIEHPTTITVTISLPETSQYKAATATIEWQNMQADLFNS